MPIFCAINTLVVFKRHFLLWLCKIEADAWFSYFYQVLECSFAEIEDIDVALPDGARRTPASFISSPGCLRLQAGGIVVAAAARRPESASSFDLVWIFYSALCARSLARDSEVLACCCGSNIEFGTESEL